MAALDARLVTEPFVRENVWGEIEVLPFCQVDLANV